MSPQPPVSFAGALGHDMADKRIAILREIGAGGSISQAARAVGVSYKAAWQALDTLTNLAGTPLVDRAVGGAGGGGAQLTDAGHQLLAAADAMAEARSAVLARWEGRAGPAAARLAVRTSMRNQWPCTVQRLELLGQIVRVHLGRAGDADAFLSARITRESAELLGLAPGLVVQALCKATAVRVERAAAAQPNPEAGVCRFPAKAVRVVRGETGDEVSAELTGGIQIVGFAVPDSGLRSGSRVLLVVEDNAVAIALAQGE